MGLFQIYEDRPMGIDPGRYGSALLFNLPYPFGKERTYLPGVHLVASQLIHSGVRAEVCDLDLQEMPNKNILASYDNFGISVIGPSSIPCAISLAKELYECTGKSPAVGGRTVEGLEPYQFEKLFGPAARQVSSDEGTKKCFNIPKLAPRSRVPLASSLKNIDDSLMKTYLEHEFSMPTDFGCAYSCRYCPAENGARQEPRTYDAINQDVGYLASRAKEFGIKQLDIYLGSLDLFQDPAHLRGVLSIAASASKDVKFRLHGLSCASSFVDALEGNPDLKDLLHAAGFCMVSFGIDSTTREFMKSQRKMHNASYSDRALDICREIAVTPGILMLTGFHEEQYCGMAKDVFYTLKKIATHGAVARAYQAKDFVPRNTGWKIISDEDYRNEIALEARQKESVQKEAGYFLENWSELRERVDRMLENPELFRNIDFQMLGTDITNPNRMKRYASNASYLALIAAAELLGKNMNYPLFPQSSGDGLIAKSWNKAAKYLNSKMAFDR